MATSRTASDHHAGRANEEAERLIRASEQGPADAVRLVRELRAQEPDLALAVVTALSKQRDPQAARTLAVIADSDLDKDLRKEARRGLHRLRAIGMEIPSGAAPTAAPAAPERVGASLCGAWASVPDWLGSRNLWLLAERPLGGVLVFSLVLNDTVGLKAARVYESTRKRFQQRLEEMRRGGAGLVDVPLDYARQLLGEALARNAQTGLAVPHEFQMHREQVQDLVRPFQGALIYQEISAGAARLAPDWLEQGAALMAEPEIATWLLPYDAIKPFAEQMQEVRGSGLVVNPLAGPERQEQIIGQAINHVVDADLRQVMKRRLEETAHVFQRTERVAPARAAVATAIALEEAGSSRLLIQQPGRQLDQIPFLRALVSRSLELAQHVLESGHVGEYPRRSPRDPIA